MFSNTNIYKMVFPNLSKREHNIEIGKVFPFMFNDEVGTMQVIEIEDEVVTFEFDSVAQDIYKRFGSQMFNPVSLSISAIGKK
jgi:hypothetical protein